MAFRRFPGRSRDFQENPEAFQEFSGVFQGVSGAFQRCSCGFWKCSRDYQVVSGVFQWFSKHFRDWNGLELYGIPEDLRENGPKGFKRFQGVPVAFHGMFREVLWGCLGVLGDCRRFHGRYRVLQEVLGTRYVLVVSLGCRGVSRVPGIFKGASGAFRKFKTGYSWFSGFSGLFKVFTGGTMGIHGVSGGFRRLGAFRNLLKLAETSLCDFL